MYRLRKTDFYNKSFATSGIRLCFKTDSRRVHVKALVDDYCSIRKYYAFEIFVDGKKAKTCANYEKNILPQDYTVIDAPLYAHEASIDLSLGETEVCIYPPWSVAGIISEIVVDDGGWVKAVKPERKMLCFGDSIFQGYDALCPSHKYTTQLTERLGAEEFDEGIGGEVFWPALAATRVGFLPDYISVACGTNDFRFVSYGRFCENCRQFYQNLRSNYPTAKIFAIMPIWHRDRDKRTDFPGFESAKALIRLATADMPGVTVIRGCDLVPRDERFYADQYLHPNDAGFDAYAAGLKKL